ncbi:flagellin [Parasalinivibrio latis]|uniref:flagellin N-terminal helical domain-containing protein n=1 Tax=Parasalinivibrio latis TaxID=2952610 RepID=UPI003DA46264
MSMTINTNVPSLSAQRALLHTQGSLDTSLQRLSTGLRINSAKDDAAGLQIATRMSSQINGLKVASRNANDGISMAQTAEGALKEYTNILQRMRDLGVQSKNGTNSTADRAALNKEYQALNKELNRITETTTYGSGEKLFATLSGKGVNFQVGANVDKADPAAASADVATSVVTDALQDMGFSTTTQGLKDFGTALAAMKKITVSASAHTGSAANLSAADATAVKDQLDKMGIQYTATANATTPANTDIALDATNGAKLEKALAVGNALDSFVDQSAGTLTGITASTDVSTLTTAMTAADMNVSLDPNVINVTVDSSALDTSALGDIMSEDDAGAAIGAIDNLIANVGSVRATLGATQNRFDSTINNLGNIGENMTAARGRIMDADIAAEAANMTKQNTMMQAGITVLSQANQMPGMVAQLLR